MVHISEVSTSYIKDIKSTFSENQEVGLRYLPSEKEERLAFPSSRRSRLRKETEVISIRASETTLKEARTAASNSLRISPLSR